MRRKKIKLKKVAKLFAEKYEKLGFDIEKHKNSYHLFTEMTVDELDSDVFAFIAIDEKRVYINYSFIEFADVKLKDYEALNYFNDNSLYHIASISYDEDKKIYDLDVVVNIYNWNISDEEEYANFIENYFNDIGADYLIKDLNELINVIKN